MPHANPRLVDLKGLSENAIANTPVTFSKDRILSRYCDDAWDMTPYLAVKNSRSCRIRFDVKFSDGTQLIEKKHAHLLDSSKRFLYVRWRVQAPHSRQYISARTLMNNWRQLVPAIKWMVDKGLTSFGELTASNCLAYAQSQQGRLKNSTRIINLQVLTTYFDLSEHLTDRLPEYPWFDTAPILLTGNKHILRANGIRLTTTTVIPKRILRLLTQRALDYLEHRSEKILETRDEILKIRLIEKSKLEIEHRKRYPNGFKSIYKSEEAYLGVRLSHVASKVINEACAKNGLQNLAVFKNEIIMLRTACHVVIAAFSGLRESEFASLEIGCLNKREGFDGDSFFWLTGMTYKLERTPKPAQWLVPEIVKTAVDIATRLGQPDRIESEQKISAIELVLNSTHVLEQHRNDLLAELEEIQKHKNALLTTSRENGRFLALGAAAANSSLRKFSKEAGAIVEPSDMEEVGNSDKVHVGEVWPLSSHQFRRTFAVFVARNLLGDLRYLREHFKHWSIDMTLYYARHDHGIDQTVFTEILTERDELQAIILEKWIKTDTPLSGGGGNRIVSFRNRGDVKTVSDMREFCRKLGEDVYIRGTGHSWCMASGNGCGGHGLYDAVRCVDCGEGVVDETHLQVWKGIREQQIQVLQCEDLGISSRQRCLDHLHASEKVLSDLGESIAPYTSRLKSF
jgi:integrase